jgi:hypothetical protein
MLLLLLACQTDSVEKFTLMNQDITPFSLVDVNETSSFYDQEVSTDQFPEMHSAWYFGHAN